MRNVRQINRRLVLLVAAALVATALLAAVGAAAAGSFAAHAQRPAYDASTLELRGHGGSTTAKRVTAEVSVPGCVKGSWRTTATGEALNPKGEWVHQASATSAPFKC
jgi:hypothetical protein